MNILAIGSHFDDLELSAGATLAKFASQGHSVWAIMTTKSDYTNYNGEILRTEQQAKIEGSNSLSLLGVQKIICLNYPTQKALFDKYMIESLNRWIDIFNPDIIITHALNESHQDHYNTAKSVMAAGRRQRTIWCFETLYPSKTSTQLFRPLIYVNIDKFMKIKLESLKMHISQYSKYPEWTDLVTSLARVRGIENGCKYAECFDLIRMEYK